MSALSLLESSSVSVSGSVSSSVPYGAVWGHMEPYGFLGRPPFAPLEIRVKYLSHASSMSGMKEAKATLSIGDSPAGFSPVSRKSQHARSTLTAVSGDSCRINSRRSSFILNQLGCLSLMSDTITPPRHSRLPRPPPGFPLPDDGATAHTPPVPAGCRAGNSRLRCLIG